MKAIIVSGILWVIGNVTHNYIGCPSVYWVPLASMIFFSFKELRKYVAKETSQQIGIDYLYALSISHLIKQIFYTETLSQINDYYVGAIITLIYLYKYIKWKIYILKSNSL